MKTYLPKLILSHIEKRGSKKAAPELAAMIFQLASRAYASSSNKPFEEWWAENAGRIIQNQLKW